MALPRRIGQIRLCKAGRRDKALGGRPTNAGYTLPVINHVLNLEEIYIVNRKLAVAVA